MQKQVLRKTKCIWVYDRERERESLECLNLKGHTRQHEIIRIIIDPASQKRLHKALQGRKRSYKVTQGQKLYTLKCNASRFLFYFKPKDKLLFINLDNGLAVTKRYYCK